MSFPSALLRLSCFVIVSISLIHPGDAYAAERIQFRAKARGTIQDSGPLKVRVEFQTILPYQLGGAIALEGTGGFQLRTSLGVTPAVFSDTLRGVINRSVPRFDTKLAELLLQRTDGPLAWGLKFGWKPPALAGVFATVGYSFVFVAGSYVPNDARQTIRSQFVGLTPHTVAHATATVHALTCELGYEFMTSPNWFVRLAVGGLFTFHGTASVKVRGILDPSNEKLKSNLSSIEEGIQQALRSYGTIPTLSLSVGYLAL